MKPNRGGRASQDRAAIYQISGARPGLSEDISARTRRYVISMGIRTVCFPLAVLTEGWVRWTFVAVALVVPYFAVIIANAGRERVDALPAAPLLDSRLALPPGAGPLRAPDDAPNAADGSPRAARERPPPPDDRPESPGWDHRASA